MTARCAACGWSNHFYGKDAAKFFRFPSKLMYPEKRDAWVAAVRRVHPDGSLWEPSGDCQICSAHFITGRPSNFKDRPDFVPTVFNYARAPGEAAVQSHDLFVERQEGDEPEVVGDASCQFTATEDIWFKCSFCAYVTIGQRGIVSHLVSHGDEQFKCQCCPVSFESMSELQCHSEMHRNDNSYDCPSSPKVSLREQLSLARVHTYKCRRCHIAFREHKDLTTHIQTHLAENPYKCKHCPKAFAHSSSLSTHTRKHAGGKADKCKQCPKVFTRRSTLTDHIRTHTDKPYQCEPFLKASAQISNQIKHCQVHMDKKPYKCSQCPKAFAENRGLTFHNRVHTGEKPYKCNLCPSAFIRPSTLTDHIRTHVGNKPYKCKQCPKTFVQSHKLTVHIRMHTNEKPYKCKLCPKAFFQKCTLTLHNRTHTGEKPFKCKLCPKTFTWRSSFTYHNRMHMGKKNLISASNF